MEQNNISLKAVERLQSMPFEAYQSYELQHSNTEWLNEVLEEICDYDRDYPDMITKPAYIHAHLDIKRDINHTLKEYLLIKAKLSVGYYTSCTRCLLPSYEQIKFKFQLCFLNSTFEKMEEYKEEDDLLVENELFDLYYYQKQNIPFKDFMREQIVLQLAHYSVHDKDCKGLCVQCGVNLNLETCKHHK